MSALDIEAGIISEATLRIGQQIHKLQFEEKLLREMLQRVGSADRDDSAAAPDVAGAISPSAATSVPNERMSAAVDPSSMSSDTMLRSAAALEAIPAANISDKNRDSQQQL